MLILGLESSCDETACAIVKDGVEELVSVVASSKEFHEVTGGIVPEVAARKQIEAIVPVISESLRKLDKGPEAIDAIAVTTGPGLIGSLLVGVEAAKALALAWNKPLIPVNHLMGHVYGNFVNNPDKIEFPVLVLIVSGGHTDFVYMRNHGDLEYLGGTLDDAVGEAFDKTARLLGLAKYLGGVQLSNLAATCENNLAQGTLPRPMLERPGFDMSFSGLKTAVKRLINENKFDNASVACEFETAVVDVLAGKSVLALEKYKPKSFLLGGGVAANTNLRTRLKLISNEHDTSFFCPPIRLCTDNAVNIASAAFFNNKSKPLNEITADPSLGVMDEA